ncbi:MAG: hypothetical protein BHW56_08340 [Acetobacter sp. 46_36]|nr:MAG: hypothetical protein BHW56_08340 [Acetobacter sp. 46_36]
MEIPTITFLTTTFLTAVLGKPCLELGVCYSLRRTCSNYGSASAKKNYADVSKKLLHNHFKLLD